MYLHTFFSVNTKRFHLWDREDNETVATFTEKYEKICAILYCPAISSEKFVAVDHENLRTTSAMADKGIWSLFKAQKDIIDVDSDDENEINNAPHVPTSSEIKNIRKSVRSYLDAHSNGEMNNKLDDVEQFVDYLMLKKTKQRKTSDYFPKTP
ncbi:uncharacterized protein TNCV_447981 [Trichonephila clavipes]|nr:uncharacterized protein TNCV_447981 [Trichonephila clavipes]